MPTGLGSRCDEAVVAKGTAGAPARLGVMHVNTPTGAVVSAELKMSSLFFLC